MWCILSPVISRYVCRCVSTIRGCCPIKRWVLSSPILWWTELYQPLEDDLCSYFQVCSKYHSHLTMHQTFWLGACVGFRVNGWSRILEWEDNGGAIISNGTVDKKVDKKQTFMKTEAYKLYCRVFWIFQAKLSSKSILIISSCTVSKLVRFLRRSVLVV